MKLKNEINLLLQTKKLLNEYKNDYSKNTNHEKIRKYVTGLTDIDSNPLVSLQNNLQHASDVIDSILLIKQTKLLELT